jgi:putative spermidine/putrescine transport system permease protein
MAPVVVPVIITAAAMFGVFRGFGLYGTLAGLILAHLVIVLPFALRLTLSSATGLDVRIEQAAVTLTGEVRAPRWSAFWRVVFPLILPAVLGLSVRDDNFVRRAGGVDVHLLATLRPVTVQMWSDIRGDVGTRHLGDQLCPFPVLSARPAGRERVARALAAGGPGFGAPKD